MRTHRVPQSSRRVFALPNPSYALAELGEHKFRITALIHDSSCRIFSRMAFALQRYFQFNGLYELPVENNLINAFKF